jgi:hypothetical protein
MGPEKNTESLAFGNVKGVCLCTEQVTLGGLKGGGLEEELEGVGGAQVRDKNLGRPVIAALSP